MKLILDIPDNQAAFMLELLRHFPFLKIQNSEEQNAHKAQMLQDLSESIDEVKLIKAGVLKGYTLEEALAELNEP